MTIHRLLTGLLLLLLTLPLAAAELDDDIVRLQQQWATIKYTYPQQQQVTALEQLIGEAEGITAKYPDAAEAWIWDGIIRSTYAGAKGGLKALGAVKLAKTHLEKALQLNDQALQGSAYTSLGALYYQVPGWPLGFGDDDKAQGYLLRALQLNPDGIDSNYFYGDFLRDQGNYPQARAALQKALQAASRPGREVADSGRREEIRRVLAEVEQKLGS